MIADGGSSTRTAGQACDAAGPCLQPFVYALDAVTPVVDLGQHDEWRIDRSTGWATAFAGLVWVAEPAGWLIGLLLAAAIGVSAKRE